MSDDPWADDEQLATLQHLILLAAIDMVRASKTGDHADVEALTAQILETADSPEHAVAVCIAVFANTVEQLTDQVGQGAAELLQGMLLTDLRSDDD